MSIRSLIALGCALAAPAALASNDWSFKNVSVNWLDWSNGTEARTEAGFAGKKDFAFLELEGGFGGSWGEAYGFFDIENPGHNAKEVDSKDNRRYAAKVSTRFNLAEVAGMPVQLYGQIYDSREHNGFFDQNRVLGLGTSWSRGNFWIKPFIGAHQELKQDVGAHFNGWMAGYVAGYSFTAFGQSFMATQWHETEFARKDRYLSMFDAAGNEVKGGKTGNNGAVALWWNVNKALTTGVQYRYADQKLGVTGYQNAMIYSVKYNF
ncbi:outer membrane protein OmpK [Craterilacuibacter sinensis]|uniref:Ion channel protein Tsx n=1 Tax=Craterilacuibacter sinensis TaxID=2686017 RepID=A0A845BIJ1_9NEIS|nr:outer membrane protein OmpK [Craterilacuibacter sinensis]MXR35982.1 hypothetical protein [Craterilacuibacter sinensis]